MTLLAYKPTASVLRRILEEDERIIAEMLREGDSETLNEKPTQTVICIAAVPMTSPHRASDLYLHPEKDDAGPTNNWMDPAPPSTKSARSSMAPCAAAPCTSCLHHGPGDSPISKAGVESRQPLRRANMRIMSRMGKVALDRIGSSSDFVPGLHSIGDLDSHAPLHRAFPQEN